MDFNKPPKRSLKTQFSRGREDTEWPNSTAWNKLHTNPKVRHEFYTRVLEPAGHASLKAVVMRPYMRWAFSDEFLNTVKNNPKLIQAWMKIL